MTKIALIFDFDDTLTSDSATFFVEQKGIDAKTFWSKTVEDLMLQDWDPVLAYMYGLIVESKKQNKPFTKVDLIKCGKRLLFNAGVNTFFENIKTTVSKQNLGVEVEFYIISSGLGDIIRNSKIAHHFTHIWASDFAYNEKDEIHFPKNVISFTDKTRFLFQIAKGIIGEKALCNPFEVNTRIPSSELRIPFEQMIYIGDGYTDIPCFSIVRRNGGIAFGVYDKNHKEKLGRAWGFVEQDRVSNLHSADYRANSDLYNSINMAIQSIANRITLKNRSM
ncbi:MAG: haloacid dehalogenase-like hydrolase [Bacteroidota bacterium]